MLHNVLPSTELGLEAGGRVQLQTRAVSSLAICGQYSSPWTPRRKWSCSSRDSCNSQRQLTSKVLGATFLGT